MWFARRTALLKSLGSTGIHGNETQYVCDAVLKSAKNGKWVNV